MSEAGAFRPEEILGRLAEAGVRFVLIGGIASQAHGSPSITRDLDVCIATDRANLEALARVLSDIMAIRGGLPPDAPQMPPIDTPALRATSLLTLSTAYGSFDVLTNPDPGFNFEMLDRGAIDAEVLGVRVRVVSLDDLISMKRAAGRPKDRIELEVLGALREEIDRL
jgi:predicted nucleotidyltransferase